MYAFVEYIKKQHYFNSVIFWIVIFFIIRLYAITNPPLEVSHNWRQTTVAMVARNFLEIDANIFYPRIDIAGNKTGITGMEFPILNYLIYLMSLVFGYQHWYGRLINLVVSSFGIFFYAKTLKLFFPKKMALFSTLILLSSLWFSFSRKIMPDTFSLSLVIIAIHYGIRYLHNKKYLHLILYSVFLALGVLAKLPAGYLLITLIPVLYSYRNHIVLISVFSMVSIFALVPAGFWYFKWVPHLVQEYGFWHFFMGKPLLEGIHDIMHNLGTTLSRFYDDALKYAGFSVFIFGLIHAIIKKEKKVWLTFVLAFIGFLMIILKSGFAFYQHNYYIIPFVPVMALVAGYGLSQISNKKVFIPILVIIILEGTLNQHPDFRIKEKYAALMDLENDLKKTAENHDLILINSVNVPTPMYFAHHKGWVEPNDKIKNIDYINNLKSKGLTIIVILKKVFGSNLELPYKKTVDNSNYTIYKLN